MPDNLLGQQVLSARELGLVPLGNAKHVYGNTATALTRPAGATAIVLDVESGSFRVQKGDTSVEGAELVTNGDFSASTGWDAGEGWVISSGTASADGTQTTDIDLTQTLPMGTLFTGYEYTVEFTTTNRTAGGVTPILGGQAGTKVITNTAASEVIRAGEGIDLVIRADSDFDGDVDNVSVKIKAITATAPTASNAQGGGTVKVRENQPVVFSGPSVLTVVGSGGTDLLTYYWI